MLKCDIIEIRDFAKLKKNPDIQITFGSGWVGPGPFWIENRNWKTMKKIKIFDDYWFPKKIG